MAEVVAVDDLTLAAIARHQRRCRQRRGGDQQQNRYRRDETFYAFPLPCARFRVPRILPSSRPTFHIWHRSTSRKSDYQARSIDPKSSEYLGQRDC